MTDPSMVGPGWTWPWREQLLFFVPTFFLLVYVIWDVWSVLHFLSYYKPRKKWWMVYAPMDEDEK